MRRFNYTNLWVYRNLSVTQRDIKCHIKSHRKARKSKSTEQYDCRLFFLLDGTCNSVVELSNSRGWEFDSTIKFNASTGEEHCDCEWFVCGVCGTEVAFDIKQAGFTVCSLFSRDQQAAVGSLLQMEVILANTSLLLNTLGLDRYLGTFIRESAKLPHMI